MRQHLKSAAERLALEAATLAEAYDRFRQTRLYLQILLSLILVGVGLVVHALPYGPLARADKAITWVANHDSDLRGAWERLDRWVGAHGGWRGAGSYVWSKAMERVEPAMRWLPSAGKDDPLAPPVTRADTDFWQETSPSETAVGSAPGAPAPATSPAPSPVAWQAPAQAPSVGRNGRVLPVEGAVLYGFGWRHFGGKDELHEGIDLAAEAGAPVRAVADGKVLRVAQADPAWGGLVEIQHGDEVAVYAGVAHIRVKTGDEVEAGDAIAAVAAVLPGPEGRLGPHLHLEIRARKTGLPVDPAYYLGLQGTGT